MQPPPRKGTYLKVCKNLHSEQLSKLLAKNQQECDLLEDIRNFTKQRSSIEKSYGEALCKIAANYQNRKIACVPDIRLEDGSEAWNVYSVWRTVLDETEKLGKARLAAVEVFQQSISEEAKITRHHKVHLGKKFSEQLKVMQNEVQSQVAEVDRAKKTYYEEEHFAHDAREKASAAEEKLKRKKGSIFQSIQSLQKNSAKFSAKRDACDEKSAGARNDYLLTLTAANIHQQRYYEVDFERILRTLECEMYDRVAEYLTLMSRTELLTCSASQSSFNKIREQATTVTRGYNLRCYLTFYPMLGQNIQYDFEACEDDRVESIIVHDESCQQILENEGKKCIATIQREVKAIREATKKIQKLGVGGKNEADLPPDVESRLDDLRLIIRKAETHKVKAEARIQLLREGAVEVEDYSKSVDSDSLGVEAETSLSRSGSTLSVREEAEAGGGVEYDRADESEESVALSSAATAATYQPEPTTTTTTEYEREDTIQSQDDSRLDAGGWDPTSVDWGDAPVSPLPPVTNGPQDEPASYAKCSVLYNYTAQNPDELTIVENEELEMLGEGDGDGWVQARNYKGEVGYIPHNYIEIEDGSAQPQPPAPAVEEGAATEAYPATETSNGMAATQQSFSSMQYETQPSGGAAYDEGEDYSSAPPADLPPPPPPIVTTAAPTGVPPALTLPVAGGHYLDGDYCRAVYDYEATCPEELTFMEGQVIKVLQREVNGVDDGWWEGEVLGEGVAGLFPSLVVEECRSDGEPFTPDGMSGASPMTTPPPHTPPEVPGFLLPPERVIITQPTPVVETVEDLPREDEQAATTTTAAATTTTTTSTYDSSNFELELGGGKQEQYSRQFSSSPESETTDRDQQYAELVSSPDVSNLEGKRGSQKTKAGAKGRAAGKGDDGLGVAQIVITAATPMTEHARIESEDQEEEDPRADIDRAESEGEALVLDDDDRQPPPPPAPEGPMEMRMGGAEGGGRRVGSIDDERSPSPKSPSPSDGPPDLDPEKLKSLERIKESIA